MGAGIASIYLLPYSMLPDAIDDIEVKTGHRFEELFYSYFVFFQKTATVGYWFQHFESLRQGVALFLSTLTLEFAGYVTDAKVALVRKM